jgi:hypothetical protein
LRTLSRSSISSNIAAVLIASEGDETLSRLINRADLAALIASSVVLILVVVALWRLREALIRRTRWHLLINFLFALLLFVATSLYFFIYARIDSVLVRSAIYYRLRDTHLPIPFSDPRAQALATEHATDTSQLTSFTCAYPGWLIRVLPVVIIPIILISLSMRRRRRETAA